GKDHYLGTYGSPESHEQYARLIAQWHSHGKKPAPLPGSDQPERAGLSIGELILRYWKFANTYYLKHGRPTGECDNLRLAFRPLRRLYERIDAAAFGPKALLLVRQSMIDAGLSRKVINARVSRIKRLFRWSCKEELIPPATYHGLLAVEGLKRDRSA